MERPATPWEIEQVDRRLKSQRHERNASVTDVVSAKTTKRIAMHDDWFSKLPQKSVRSRNGGHPSLEKHSGRAKLTYRHAS